LTQVRASGGNGSVTLVGFSHGGLLALACGLWLGGGGRQAGKSGQEGVEGFSDLYPGTLDSVHLFNCGNYE